MLKNLALKLYYFATDEKRIVVFRRVDGILRKIGGKAYIKTLGQLKYKLRFNRVTKNEDVISENVQWDCEKAIYQEELPLVSILVPYKMNGKQKKQNSVSSDYQTYKNTETLLIPVLPADNFLTWIEKGLTAAKGQLVWIKETNFDCSEKFLENVIPLFDYRSVMMVMQKDALVNLRGEGELFKEVTDALFFVSATNFVKELFDKKCFEVNIDGMLFRNPGQTYIEKDCFHGLDQYDKLLWILNLIKGGVVGCTNKGGYWYEQQDEVVVQEKRVHELETVSCFVASKYKLDLQMFHKLEAQFGKELYSLIKIREKVERKLPNVIIACYALKSGGGETYPIYLANEMKRKGMTITILNFGFEESEKEIVGLIEQGIPVVNIKHTDYIGKVLQDIGVDIIHSHHATVDYSVAVWLGNYPGLAKHIITLHGMYEMMEEEDCTRTILETSKSVYKYVYIADKNLDCFKKRKAFIESKFCKMINGLPEISVHPVERDKLGIGEADFVLILASRAIPGKGWKETISAVVKANAHSKRPIHLVLLGDGEIKKKVAKGAPKYIHFMGTVSNVRDYFAMGDAGVLVSTYKGESYPIVIMECLAVGKPVIATNIAEVPKQIEDAEGKQAGLLIPVKNWEIHVDDISNAILEMANNQELYEDLKRNAFSAREKFDMSKIVEQYLQLYQEACDAGVK